MEFRRYADISPYRNAVLDVLLENEVQNNLPLSLAAVSRIRGGADWFLAAVLSDGGRAMLTALCVKPFVMMLYETGNIRNDEALALFARELQRIGYTPRGVMAEPGLARRFADAMCDPGKHSLHFSMFAMRLDNLSAYEKAPGFCRTLDSRDMFFAPYWERAFSEDCRSHVFSIKENVERLKTRLETGTHHIWEDGAPVSQAVHGRDTPNGAVVSGVYTPPHYRGRGYATSVVSELSESLLNHGKKFCCLFADADNPVSRGIYKKLGYYDVCQLDEIRFDMA